MSGLETPDTAGTGEDETPKGRRRQPPGSGVADTPDGTIGVVPGSPFELVFQEIPIFVYENADHCPDCSRVSDRAMAEAPAGMQPPTFDISVSFDGAMIATDAFRDLCHDLPGAVFTPLDGTTGCWRFDVDEIVRIDPFDSHVRAGTICETCGEPRYVIRSGPLHFHPHEMLQPGFSRTDAGFGDTADFGSTQPVWLRPHVLLDRDTGRALKQSGLLGIHLIAQPEPET